MRFLTTLTRFVHFHHVGTAGGCLFCEVTKFECNFVNFQHVLSIAALVVALEDAALALVQIAAQVPFVEVALVVVVRVEGLIAKFTLFAAHLWRQSTGCNATLFGRRLNVVLLQAMIVQLFEALEALQAVLALMIGFHVCKHLVLEPELAIAQLTLEGLLCFALCHRHVGSSVYNQLLLAAQHFAAQFALCLVQVHVQVLLANVLVQVALEVEELFAQIALVLLQLVRLFFAHVRETVFFPVFDCT